MTFTEAKNYRFVSGRWAGRTIDDIASTDEGLEELDRLLGWEKLNPGRLKDSLTVFFEDPAIATDRDRVVDDT